jgi:thiamine-monophosphate kinase
MAARGELKGFPAGPREALVQRYRLPVPRLDLELGAASAAADISDGLVADAGHIAEASGVGMELDLSAVPLSPAARIWLAEQPDQRSARVRLATGGDDYEIVATAPVSLPGFTVVGRVIDGQGVTATIGGAPVEISRAGWRHGNES